VAPNRYSPAEALAIRHAVESGDLSSAIQLHRALFPPVNLPFMRNTDESDLRNYLEAPLPIFAFCSETELRELRLRMAVAVCLGNFPIEKAFVPDVSFPWPHLMSPGAVAQNFFKATTIHRSVTDWRNSGCVEAVKILNSSDDPCQSCIEAAVEYSLSDLPLLPLHTCENVDTIGCRCSIVATKITGLSRKW
jgi:hypothetical protein